MAILERRAIYRFGGFVLDFGNEALRTTEGVAIPLRPKSFALLRLMVENAGRLVARATIMEALWPNLFVSDDNITQCVLDIRRALGHEACELLRTLPRRGYIFEADAVRQEPVYSTQIAGVDALQCGGTTCFDGDTPIAAVELACTPHPSPPESWVARWPARWPRPT